MVKIPEDPIVCLLLDYNLAYINSPLNGCTTIKTLLMRAAGYDDIPWSDVHETFQPENAPQGLAVAYGLKEVPNSFFKFCSVRNPYDRVVSFYEAKWRQKDESGEKPSLYHRYEPYDWEQGFSGFTKWLKDFGMENTEHHAMTQYDNLRVEQMDDIVRFENFEQELFYLLRWNGIPFETIPNLGQKPRDEDYKTYYNQESRKRIRELYRVDLENLDYEF